MGKRMKPSGGHTAFSQSSRKAFCPIASQTPSTAMAASSHTRGSRRRQTAMAASARMPMPG